MEKAIIVAIVSFIVATVGGKLLIPVLHRFKFGQTIREEGPAWHASKGGTPTMGGIMFILSSTVALLIAQPNKTAVAVMVCALLYALIGFVDDFIKVVLKRNLGLTSAQKFLAQIVVALLFIAFLYWQGMLPTALKIPFGGYVDFGLFTVPFAMFVLLATTNSVNLTDGLDGLAGTTSLIVTIFFAALTSIFGEGGISLYMIAIAAGLVGFLIYNHHPAKVFMGDTGSLFLGGALGAAAIAVGAEWYLVIAGFVFLFETLSVIIQVAYKRKTGKKFFKMTPIHHHFEMCEMRETQIVLLFSAVTLACCLLAYFAI